MDTTKDNLILMMDMARAQGIDMAEARARRVVDDAGLSTMLTACRGCDKTVACRATLDAGAIPQGCPNSERWDTLHALLWG